MIRIEKLHIHEFRGIRDLTLDLKDQNFAACGPNGTGKSGIVDAIEFALTGNISRLSGAGTGGLSVKAHGPHVDSRNKPESAFVVLDVVIPSLGLAKAKICRTVKAATAPTILPDNADVMAAFESVSLHPEFVLSRRELIRYVLSEPGQRSKEVQSLLRLDDIEKLRGVLQKIANACSKEIPPLERAQNDAKSSFLAALGAPELSKTFVLQAVNQRRQVLGLPPLADLDATTSVKDGLATTATATLPRISKAQATADFTTLRTAWETLASESLKQACATARRSADELAKDAASLDGLTREALLTSALELYDGESCPVCDTPFESTVFEEHVAAKLNHLDAVTKKRAALEGEIKPILDALHSVGTALAAVIADASEFSPKLDMQALLDFKTVLLDRYQRLRKLLPLGETSVVLAEAQDFPDLSEAMNLLATAIEAIPEPTKQDAARDFLVLAQERLEHFRAAQRNVTTGKLRSERATKVLDTYGVVTTAGLEKIYGSSSRMGALGESG